MREFEAQETKEIEKTRGTKEWPIFVTATEFQNNFSKYRKKVKEGAEITVTANGKEEMTITKARPYKFSDLADMFHGQLTNVNAKDVWEMRRQDYYNKFRNEG